MNRLLLLKTIIVFCLISSCKTQEESEVLADNCELFNIGPYSFFNPRVYERPVIFEKGGNALLHKEYVPMWYGGYCAENLPSYFKTKEDFLKHIPSEKIAEKSLSYYDNLYETNKTNLKGLNTISHENYHLLFRGTVNVKNSSSGKEYLLVAGKSYIADELDYDKNTDYYESDVKSMFAFLLEDGIYKSISLDDVLGNFSKPQYDKVFDILNTKTLIKSVCVENVNTVKKPNFNSLELPTWVYTKSEVDEDED